MGYYPEAAPMRDRFHWITLVSLLIFGLIGAGYSGKGIVNVRGSIIFEWSSKVGVNHVFTIALLKDGSTYDVVTGNGSHIVIVNGSGYVKEIINVKDRLDISDDSIDIGFGYLGSNVTHVYATVVDLEPMMSIYGGNYVKTYVFLVSSLKSSNTPYAIVYRNIGNLPIRDFDPRLKEVSSDIYRKLIPTIRTGIGNLTSPVFSSAFYVGSSVLTLIEEDDDYININCDCREFGFTTGHVLSYANGNQLIIALNDTINGDIVVVYSLYEDTDGNIYIDYNNSAYAGNISYTGFVPDVAATDVDGDKIEEIVIDNSTGLFVLEEDTDTKDSSLLSVKCHIGAGVVDRLMLGNFSGDWTPEFIFYDPVNSELEVWNSSSKIYSLVVDGDPVADIVLCELDGDGYVDIFLLTNTAAYLIYGCGQYNYLQLPATPTSNGLIADIDGDTYLEIVFVANDTMYCYQTSFTKLGNRQLLNSYAKRTFVLDSDTDLDGISDWEEVYVYSTSPYKFDTDDDGMSDWEEIYVYGTSPISPDRDIDNNYDNITVSIENNEKSDDPELLPTLLLGSVDIYVVSLFSIFSSALLVAAKEGKYS